MTDQEYSRTIGVLACILAAMLFVIPQVVGAQDPFVFEHRVQDYADHQPIACGGPNRSGVVYDYVYVNRPRGTIIPKWGFVAFLDTAGGTTNLWQGDGDVVVGEAGFVRRYRQDVALSAGTYRFGTGVPGETTYCSVVSRGPQQPSPK